LSIRRIWTLFSTHSRIQRAGETHAERGREFPDREFVHRQLSKHRPARWIRECVENSVQMRRILNHVV